VDQTLNLIGKNLSSSFNGYSFSDFHPQVQKNLLRLLIFRPNLSLDNIIKEIAGWQPNEQLYYLEFLILKISERINRAINIEPQVIVLSGRKFYRVDFKLALTDHVMSYLPPILYFVELDGFSFHDRTREEFTKARQRLRNLQREGAKVYPFSAEEVFKDPARCVLETVRGLERDIIERRYMIVQCLCNTGEWS